ncbi:unnamed protein product [Moneuplotes crassus]|uniref:Uncharacterized protein n=1 Tax=Euplotes crassus TaxID=5936 RepID=A0AAD1X6M2_EUPCR|nr:unnamed protein product [Moneuplotes crassus]
MLEERKLLEKGFNATLIETEDIHVHRRSMEDIYNHKIKQCSKIIKEKGNYYPPELKEAIYDKIKPIFERTQKVIERSRIEQQPKEMPRKETPRKKHLKKKIKKRSKKISKTKNNIIFKQLKESQIEKEEDFPIKSHWPSNWRFKGNLPDETTKSESSHAAKNLRLHYQDLFRKISLRIIQVMRPNSIKTQNYSKGDYVEIPNSIEQKLPDKTILEVKSVNATNACKTQRDFAIKEKTIRDEKRTYSIPLKSSPSENQFTMLKSQSHFLTHQAGERKDKLKAVGTLAGKNKINRVYLAKPSKKTPKISTEKFRRRFGVDPEKIESGRVKIDKEYLGEEVPKELQKIQFEDPKYKLGFGRRSYSQGDISHLFNEISSIMENAMNPDTEAIKEEDDTTSKGSSPNHPEILSKSCSSLYSSFTDSEKSNKGMKITTRIPKATNKDFANLIEKLRDLLDNNEDKVVSDIQRVNNHNWKHLCRYYDQKIKAIMDSEI